MKISVKLHFIFLIIMMLIGIIGVFTTFQIYNLFKLSTHLQNHNLVVKSNAVHEINVDVVKIVNQMKEIVYFSNEMELTKNLTMITAYEQNIYLNFNQIEQKFRGDKRYFDKVTRLFEEWKAIRNETIALSKNGLLNEDKYIMIKNKGDLQVKKLEKALDKLHQFMEEKAEQFANQTHSATQPIFQISIAMVILIFMLEWLVFTMSRKIIKDITLIHKRNETNSTNHPTESKPSSQTISQMQTQLPEYQTPKPSFQKDNHQVLGETGLTETTLSNNFSLEPMSQTKAKTLQIKPAPKSKHKISSTTYPLSDNKSFTSLLVEEDLNF